MRARKPMAIVCAWLTLLASVAPVASAGDPADDLRQIEYRYYFRGKYPQAIEALQTFLARIDVTGDVALRANEFLAASHVLSGAPATGKDVFVRLIAANPAYAGPDASVFKPEVLDVYGVARTEFASLALKNAAPAAADTLAVAAPNTAASAAASKPIYRKWWFYAGAAAVVGVVAAVAGGGGDSGTTERPATGTVIVGVTVK